SSSRGDFFRSVSVYLFDGNSFFLENLAFFLNRQNGIIVIGKTTSIEEARQLTKNSPPEVIILGIGMFNKEGYYALLSLWQGIPVIVLGLDEEDKEEALKRGAYAFFRKGENKEELLATIRKKKEETIKWPFS
ncbi:MAG TPA: response regulator, partial [Candidatus Atribacteria bacterium]|nr:response regulator [Candidatus Atribacteria bacterium]